MSSVFIKSYNGFVESVGKWLEQKFLEWQVQQGKRSSLDEFAEYLGYTRAYISMILNGSRKNLSMESANQLGKRLNDYSILDILGYARPFSSLDFLPPELRSDFESAWLEISNEVKTRNIDAGSEEAERIAINILERHGWIRAKE